MSFAARDQATFLLKLKVWSLVNQKHFRLFFAIPPTRAVPCGVWFTKHEHHIQTQNDYDFASTERMAQNELNVFNAIQIFQCSVDG